MHALGGIIMHMYLENISQDKFYQKMKAVFLSPLSVAAPLQKI